MYDEYCTGITICILCIGLTIKYHIDSVTRYLESSQLISIEILIELVYFRCNNSIGIYMDHH